MGIYASLTTIMISGQLVISALLTYFLPKLNNSIKTKNIKKYLKLLSFMVIIAMILGISLILIVILFGDNIVTILLYKRIH